MEELEVKVRASLKRHLHVDVPPDADIAQALDDELHDFGAVVTHLTRFSHGRISKPLTLPEEVFSVADEFCRRDIEEAIAEIRAELRVTQAVAETRAPQSGIGYRPWLWCFFFHRSYRVPASGAHITEGEVWCTLCKRSR